MARIGWRVQGCAVMVLVFLCLWLGGRCFAQYYGLFGMSPGLWSQPAFTTIPSQWGQSWPSSPLGQPWSTSPLGQSWSGFGMTPYSDIRTFPSISYGGSAQTKTMKEGELIVGFSGGVSIEHHTGGPHTNIAEINELIEQFGIYEISASSSGAFHVLKFPDGQDVEEVRRAFSGIGGYVEYTEPNYVTRKAHSGSASISYPSAGTGLSFLPQTSPLQSFTPSFTFPYGAGTGLGTGWGGQPFTYSQPSSGGWNQSFMQPSFSMPWSSFGTFMQPSYGTFLQPSFGSYTGLRF
ncbi:MAG: S8 family serine peptidase [bacterium]